MVYIVAVNPLLLENAQMDFGAVFVATCLASAFGCILMGLPANLPVALAPGMGLNRQTRADGRHQRSGGGMPTDRAE